jgi:hypothetical protein
MYTDLVILEFQHLKGKARAGICYSVFLNYFLVNYISMVLFLIMMWGKKQLSPKEKSAIQDINSLIVNLEKAEEYWKQHSPTQAIRINYLGHAPPDDFFPLVINKVLEGIRGLALNGLGFFLKKMRKSIKLVQKKNRESYQLKMAAIASTLKNKSDKLIASEFSYFHFGEKKTNTYIAHLDEEMKRTKRIVKEKKPKDKLDEEIQNDIAEIYGATPYEEAQNLHKALEEEKSKLLAFRGLLGQSLAKYEAIIGEL